MSCNDNRLIQSLKQKHSLVYTQCCSFKHNSKLFFEIHQTSNTQATFVLITIHCPFETLTFLQVLHCLLTLITRKKNTAQRLSQKQPPNDKQRIGQLSNVTILITAARATINKPL